MYYEQPSYNALSNISEIMLKFLQKWEPTLTMNFSTESIFKCNPLH